MSTDIYWLLGIKLKCCSSVRVRASPSSECGDCSLGMNMYEPHYWPGLGWAGLGWSPPAALFVHIVNIKFHNTFAFTVVTRHGVAAHSTLPRPRAGRSRTVIIVMTVLTLPCYPLGHCCNLPVNKEACTNPAQTQPLYLLRRDDRW